MRTFSEIQVAYKAAISGLWQQRPQQKPHLLDDEQKALTPLQQEKIAHLERCFDALESSFRTHRMNKDAIPDAFFEFFKGVDEQFEAWFNNIPQNNDQHVITRLLEGLERQLNHDINAYIKTQNAEEFVAATKVNLAHFFKESQAESSLSKRAFVYVQQVLMDCLNYLSDWFPKFLSATLKAKQGAVSEEVTVQLKKNLAYMYKLRDSEQKKQTSFDVDAGTNVQVLVTLINHLEAQNPTVSFKDAVAEIKGNDDAQSTPSKKA